MNYKRIVHMLSVLLFVEALFMLPPALLAVYDGETAALRGFVAGMLAAGAAAVALRILSRGSRPGFYAREGFLMVAVSWILLSLFGALPLVISGEIASPADAFFEIVSGFTTTGASVVTQVEELGRPILYWRSFSNWLGGMGILVFLLAVLPTARGEGNSLHILRAESPGPDVAKMTPKLRSHAVTLYALYLVMTAACLAILLIQGMPLFDSVCTAFSTAGTGGFGIKNDSMASYAPGIQITVAVFMMLFGVNFNIYYLLLVRRFRAALRDEEWKAYIGILLVSTGLIALNAMHAFASAADGLLHAGFAVSSIMTTTGFTTADYSTWPQFSRVLLLILMMLGGSAGSTAGGIKVARLLLLAKSVRRDMRRRLHPREVKLIRLNGNVVSDGTLNGLQLYMMAYIAVLVLSFLLVSLDNLSLETNLSAVISCINNVGPALGDAGPAGNYAGFSVLSKLVLTADMLLGRLEFIPILIFLNTKAWNRAY